MPPPACGHPVDDVRREEFDPVLGERGRQQARQLAVFVVAHPAVGAYLVDHYCDRRIGPGSSRDLGDVLQRRDYFVRKVNAHNASHLTAIDGDKHERSFGHKAEHGGQGGDQNTGAIEVKVG
ncbi:MAG: hypothetical protein NVS4B6_12970 [Mycobacterium sp.]